jgi:uncharacterized protein with PQ loop repeat
VGGNLPTYICDIQIIKTIKMKTMNNLDKASLIAFIISVVIIFTIINVNAQQVTDSKSVLMFETTRAHYSDIFELNKNVAVVSNEFEKNESVITNVDIKVIDNVAYLKWYSFNDLMDGLFVIEKLNENGEFVPVGYKQRIGNENNTNITLMYCWKDNNAGIGQLVYRILELGKDNSFIYKKLPVIKNEPQNLVSN